MTTRALLSLLLVLPACAGGSGDEADAMVEPAIAEVVPGDMNSGSFVLTVYVNPEAESSTEVWLYELRASPTTHVAGVSSDVSFPIELEPGELGRVRFDYTLTDPSCTHELSGTIYDSLTGDLTEVSSAAVSSPDCR